MPDPISQCKSYVLTAAGTTPEDHLAALVTHLESAPAFWQRHLVSTNEGVSAELKVPYTIGPQTFDPHVGIRRAPSGWRVFNSPSKTLTSPGTAAAAATDSGDDWSGELESFTPSGLSNKLLVTELPDAIFVVLVGAGLNASPWACWLGGGGIPRKEYRQFGLDGHVALSGLPTNSGTNAWLTTSNNGSRVKSGNTTSKWGKVGQRSSNLNEALFDPDDTGILVGCVSGYDITANDNLSNSTSDDVAYGRLAYFGEYPDRLRGTQPPLTTVINAGAQNYLVINSTSANTNRVIPWEHSTPPVLT